jgi:ATP-dependent Zn protease
MWPFQVILFLLAANPISVYGLQCGTMSTRALGYLGDSSSKSRLEEIGIKRYHSGLFMSSGGEGLSPKQNPVQKLLLAVRQTLLRVKAYPPRISARFSKLSRRAKSIIVVQMIALAVIFGFIGRNAYTSFQHARGSGGAGPPIELPYSRFLDLCEESGSNGVQVENLRVGADSVVYWVTKEATGADTAKRIVAFTRKVPASPELIHHLRTNGIHFTALPMPRANAVGLVLRGAVLSFYMLILWRMYKTFSGNAGPGDVPGKLASPLSSLPSASFNDIQGVDVAKQEVMELVDALRNPEKYAILGARAPTGLLLEGPPGTGKTLLARATAATAGVPLLYCSGSDFVEMFVGRGAARVRKLFERAARMSPCIIFVDELDALGKSRDMGGALGGFGGRGNDEAEQTLNQLLACMDGLDSNKRICVLAATNRKEVLDPALIRPGRFDRIVTLSLPDAMGRENILRVHARKLPGFQEGQGIDERRPNSLGVGEKVDLSAIAALTSGFSGAELEYLVNEAAIRAVRRVSSALREGRVAGVTPHVLAEDFESSLANFYATRKSKSVGLDDVWKNVWRQ